LIVSIEMSNASVRLIRAHGRAAASVVQICAESLKAAGAAGADDIKRRLVGGELGIKASGTGIAAGLSCWPIDEAIPMVAVGVAANHPSAAYAKIQNDGGDIRPKTAKALAVPLNEEARAAMRNWGPAHRLRQLLPGLVMIPKVSGDGIGILARKTGKGTIQPMFALRRRVTIKATHWLDLGIAGATPLMTAVLGEQINRRLGEAATAKS